MDETNSDLGTYHHTQKGPWFLLLSLVAAASLTAGWYMPVPALSVTFAATGLFMYLLGASLGNLTVEDEGHRLAIRFGPFPLFRKRVSYDDILKAETDRTTFLDGWGIHWNPWGGWVWNIWGRDCVVLRLKRGTLKVGTDDADGLVRFLKNQIREQNSGA